MKKLIGLFLLSTLFVGCKPYSDSDLAQFDAKIKAYETSKQLDLETSPSGLHYKIIKGDGDRIIKQNDVIKVSYVGALLDGTEFDKQATPIEFKVRELIPAWKEALAEMAVGDSCILLVPPNIGYKGEEKGEIPAHSILHFNIKVHEAY